ncbi:histidine kinase [Luteimicrobium subarcticum]|uniref:histidine kinase n=1 Tax=Luteimicrobium subarcticum TaxID=620910 RepID=A0A2M8W6L1_9MICO|nr:histidine kinase [Luteimicrobium subarcticum]
MVGSTRPGARALVVLATVVLGVLVVGVRDQQGSLDHGLWVEVGAQVLAAVLLWWGPRRPGPVLVGCCALAVVSPTVAAGVASLLVGLLVPGASGVWWLVGGILAGPGLVAATAESWSDALPGRLGLAVLLAAWFVGRAAATRRAAAGARSVGRRAAAEHLVVSVRELERARLAREMHDLAAHRMSEVVLRANLLETRVPDTLAGDVVAIRDAARAALDELRQLLDVLRRDESDEHPEALGLGALEALVAESRSVGQPVTLEVVAARDAVPGPAERTAVRVVREALTNAARHAPGAATSVTVRDRAPATLEVVVHNGAPVREPVDLPTAHVGLTGLRERVALIGGTVDAGPSDDGGFEVRAELPRTRGRE